MLHLLISKYLNAIIKLDNFILQKKGFFMNLNIEKDIELQMIKQVDRIMLILYPKNNKSDKIYGNVPLVIECNTGISNSDIILKILNMVYNKNIIWR